MYNQVNNNDSIQLLDAVGLLSTIIGLGAFIIGGSY